jgi:hypothetical protein
VKTTTTTKSALATVTALTFGFAACNYTDGECYPRDPGGENAGVGGSVIIPTGVGGYGDVPPEPQDATGASEPPVCNAGEETPAGAEVRCLVPGSETCVQQCHAIEAFCIHLATHPYSPSSGSGNLDWCKGGWPSYTCSYQFSNGDNCTLIYPLGKWFCLYDGGKK